MLRMLNVVDTGNLLTQHVYEGMSTLIAFAPLLSRPAAGLRKSLPAPSTALLALCEYCAVETTYSCAQFASDVPSVTTITEVVTTIKGRRSGHYSGYAYRQVRESNSGTVTFMCLCMKSNYCKGKT